MHRAKPVFSPHGLGTKMPSLSSERFFIDYYGEKTDIRIGRQALVLGLWSFMEPQQSVDRSFPPWENRSGVAIARELGLALGDGLHLGRYR